MKVFIENQRFNQWWFYLIMIIPLLSLVIPLMLQTEKSMVSKDLSDLLIPLLIFILVYLFIFSIQLKTRIDEKGVYYQFFPFNRKLKLIHWHELEQCFCRKYKPMTEFGGWGYRVKLKNSKALSIRGKWGIQLVLMNGKKILIGTQKQEDVKRILENYQHKISPAKFDNSY